MTYAGLGLGVVAACAALAAWAVVTEPRRGRRPGRLLAVLGLTAAALCLLTAVFDSLMIASDLFRYDEAALVGPRVGRAPVEDLAWPLAAALALPSLLALTDRARSSEARR
ncbi:lycopene cyclase domain-containing protein [Cellulomonas palmilytica]|uniref:lycopene cyclase domain-containing protein n=1 Tax=Cellulomonas palmilytica TaxID=2608402 RepID=UPI001F1B4C6D|nr:lycopene cyclase domain-containing protein [Cellulomonas palmilytica]UJP39133.1 lycopene cyclase domain-containing protein [Cellulomonas palmilytica]